MLREIRRCSTITISLHHLLLRLLLHLTLRGCSRLKNDILAGKWWLLERGRRCSLGCWAILLALVSGLKRRATLAHVVIGVTCRSVLRIGLLHGLDVFIFGLGVAVLSELC